MNRGLAVGEAWQAASSWRGRRGLAATEGSTWTPYWSWLTRTFAAPAPGGHPAVPVPGGRHGGRAAVPVPGAAAQAEGRPAATAAAAAPARSRPRREIRGDDMCSLTAGGTPQDRIVRTPARRPGHGPEASSQVDPSHRSGAAGAPRQTGDLDIHNAPFQVCNWTALRGGCKHRRYRLPGGLGQRRHTTEPNLRSYSGGSASRWQAV